MNIDKLKQLLDVGFAVEALLRELLDGVSVFEIPKDIIEAISVFSKVKNIYPDLDQCLAEYKDLNDAEAQELKDYVTNHYGVAPDKVDQIIKLVLTFLIEMHSVVKMQRGQVKA